MDLRVGQCVLTTSVWRAFGRGDELFGLDWQKGQGDWSDTLDLQPRREQVRLPAMQKSPGRLIVLRAAARSMAIDDMVIRPRSWPAWHLGP